MNLQRAPLSLAGVFAGAAKRLFIDRNAARIRELARSADTLAIRIASQVTRDEVRFRSIESGLDQHDHRLREIPSVAHLVAAMEDLVFRAMTSFEQRLTVQERSIQALHGTTIRTEWLVQRVLAELDSRHCGRPGAQSTTGAAEATLRPAPQTNHVY